MKTKKYKCICCEQQVNNHGDYVSNSDWMHFGYGSIHDMNKFFVTICDSCVTEKQAKGILKKPIALRFN